jgi:predicted dienelactone hydrolase
MNRQTALFAAHIITALAFLLAQQHAAAQPADLSAPKPTDAAQTRDAADGGSHYKADAGPFATGETSLTLHDVVRDKDLQIRVRYPKNALAAVPLVLFSHGMGGSNNAFTDLTTHWASHGYVVILPTHDDSLKLRKERGEDVSDFVKAPNTYARKVDPPGRVADLSLILDQIDQIQAKAALKTVDGRPLIDMEHIGVAGHSAGALTTQLAIGVKARTKKHPLRALSEPETRFDCAIVISGQGTTNRMFVKDSWSEVSKPMFVIAGSEDVTRVGNETPASRREPFERAKPGDKYLLWIEGATHSSYQGKQNLALLGETPSTDISIIAAATSDGTMAFLDAYLKTDGVAKKYLASEDLANASGGKAELTKK